MEGYDCHIRISSIQGRMKKDTQIHVNVELAKSQKSSLKLPVSTHSFCFLLTLLVVGHLAYRSNNFVRTSMPSKTVWNMNYFG